MDNRKFRTLRKLSAVVLVLSVLFALTGCIRYEAKTTVKTDGTCDFTFTYAIADVASSGDTNMADSAMEKFLDTDWDVDEYEEKAENTSYKGFTATLSNVDLLDLPDELAAVDIKGITVEEEDGEYTMSWDASSTSSDAQGQGVTADNLDQYGGYMRVVLQLPGKVIESNGEESNGGKTVTWNLLDLEEDTLEARFNLKSSGSKLPLGLILGIVGGVVAVAVIVVVIVMISKKKKNNAPDPVAPAAFPQAPVAPQAFPQAPVAPQAFPQAPAAPVAPQAPAMPQTMPVAPAPEAPAAPQAPSNDPQNPGAPTV